MATEFQHLCGGQIAIEGRTHDDTVADLIEGPSGLLATQKPWNRCRIHKDALVWDNGSVGYIFSGDKPQKRRGKNIGFRWVDELPHWQYPQECWDVGDFSLRAGEFPCAIVTSTPLPHPTYVKIANDPKTKVIRGTTFDNVLNIPIDTLKGWIEQWDGTDLGQQELYAEILDGSANALWAYADILRKEAYELPGLFRTVVAIDPAGGSTLKTSAETGIVVAGIDYEDVPNGYVLGDYSGKLPSTEWARIAIEKARFHGADAIIGETNFGGDMVMTTIRQHPHWPMAESEGVALKTVTAIRSKGHRAQPIAALYQQHRIYHIGNPEKYRLLEHQYTHFDPSVQRGKQASPDRLDAAVHAFTELFPDKDSQTRTSAKSDQDVQEWDEMLDLLGQMR